MQEVRNAFFTTEKKSYDCWLGYHKLEDSSVSAAYAELCSNVVVLGDTIVLNSAAAEINNGIKSMLGKTPNVVREFGSTGSIVLGVLGTAGLIDNAVTAEEKAQLGEEGFLIKASSIGGVKYILVAGKTDIGVLYGTFALLRFMRMQKKLLDVYAIENPKNPIRMLNQWDNMDGSIERGYAGKSIFYRDNKFIGDMERIRDYARLMSSVGLNAISINNVNVHKVETLLVAKEFLPQVARVAAVFREYGIKTFLSINYSSSIELGNLQTADPLDEAVGKWWREKAKEIYEYVPDLGGFLVKADSEFRPGPFTYGRNHAEGANMLAEALEPFGGLVIWRCFVYNCRQDWRDRITDRANAAYDNFMPLDGKFKDNVILQIKNGPMDFQVREPVSPLLGGLQKTNQILELQITQEYTGQQKHLCYLIPQWKEVLEFDTFAKGEGSTIKRIVDGSVFPQKHHGFAAVSNIGDDMNWTGHDLAQANLYGYGRLAWNPDLSSEEITDEWVRLTFNNEEAVVKTISSMLMDSWGIYESYTSPLGIGWMVNPGHHYGPNVEGYEFSAWGTYHRADCNGIGVDRTVRAGTGYAGRYHAPNAEKYETIETCPEELLLFFHYVPYKHRLKSGETLIQYIYNTHFEGVERAAELKEKWLSIKEKVDQNRFEAVLKRFEIQIESAKEWRDIINTYFFRKSGIADEKGRRIY